MLRMPEEVPLGQKAGEQHTMPMRVGRSLNQPLYLLLFGIFVEPVAKCPRVRPQTTPKLFFLL
ncbi:hypothetical protein D3C87_1276390 [compost metagenome]